MVDHSRLSDALTEFVEVLTYRYEIGRVLCRLTERCVHVLDCRGAGVAIRSSGDRLEYVTATDEAIAHIEERQIDGGEGPCHDAFRSTQQIVCPDLEDVDGDRWPAYRPAALREDVRAVAGIPLTARGQALGALNVYWSQPHQCSEEELNALQLLADMAAAYITNLSLIEDAERLNEQLHHALDSRVVIEQAKGIVGERHGIEPDAAFELLRDYARARQERVRGIAEQIVHQDLRILDSPVGDGGPDMPAPDHRVEEDRGHLRRSR